MDPSLVKNYAYSEKDTGGLIFYILIQETLAKFLTLVNVTTTSDPSLGGDETGAHFPHPHSRVLDQVPHEVNVTTSALPSEPTLGLKPKPFDLKPNRDILPEKTGTRLTRYLQCKSSRGSLFTNAPS